MCAALLLLHQQWHPQHSFGYCTVPATGLALLQETTGPALNDSWAQNVPASLCFVAVLLSGVAVPGARACT
jgi:hypothetical protein